MMRENHYEKWLECEAKYELLLKKYQRRALYRDDLKLRLGAKRTGAGVHFVFDTAKVVVLKQQISNEN